MMDSIDVRVHGDASLPTLVHLPGLHGDWTLRGAFRKALGGRARLVEVSYPRRTDWKLEDFAAAVSSGAVRQGVTRGWLLGESFSSLVAWTLVGHSLDHAVLRTSDPAMPSFQVAGLILVGGFVRHPWPLAVRLALAASRRVPMRVVKGACNLYARSAARRLGGSSEFCAQLQEFVARRSREDDRAAINSRYELIVRNDLRPVARRATLPVFHLSGAIDPMVPWWQVRPWLRAHCPGYRASRILPRAGHNVLLDAATLSANQILAWVTATEGGRSSAEPAGSWLGKPVAE